jgi:hypothetical protein
VGAVAGAAAGGAASGAAGGALSRESSSAAAAGPASPKRRKGITDIILAIFALSVFELFAATGDAQSEAPLKLRPDITISFKFCT